ncbi:hypothetical protein HU200_049295 [Digitaria exilis]|uniref:Expansin n=1 Tax=Digitaria exilis TaxID=1010633 RepID=A0A835ATA0_9POAL|nr:hypothetical protein HU200_049295 [Digitaria exilis]
MAMTKSLILLCAILAACLTLAAASWSHGTATFYGGDDGSDTMARVKGDNTGWIQMSRNWGANWQALAGLVGQGLSFSVTSTGGQTIQFLNVVPGWWQFGTAFSTNKNFIR